VWAFLSYQTSHAPWRGCAVWDLIQPSFMFMVGVAMPYSLAARRAKGQTFGPLLRHALGRALALIVLGIFLRSVGRPETNFTFEDVLTQIGLGYPLLFLLAWRPPRVQAIAAAAILVLTWAAFALYPVPAPGLDTRALGVPPDWPYHLHGFAQHWDKNTNLAAAFDRWFLNLFPRSRPFVFNGGGYQTLSFVPSLATMIFGMLAGHWLRRGAPTPRAARDLALAGVAGLVVGNALDLLGVCPSVKRIWTPSWTLVSAGWTCLLLAGFYYVVDVRGRRRWTFPLLVVGMNSIAMYCLNHLFEGFAAGTLRTHLGPHVFEIAGKTFAPMVQHAAMLAVLWLILLWMYRRKIFLRL
jgi:predicted acyltransferase